MRPLFHSVLLVCLLVALAPAQTGSVIAVPIGQPGYAPLKAYLKLTDTQVQSLLDIQAGKNAAQQAIYKQISEKQVQLNMLLNEGTADALTVGQLEIDINNLRKQLPLPNSSYRDQALAVLTPEQKAQLPNLVQAFQLQQPASQAITLDLIDAPYGGGPVPVRMGGLLEMGAPADGR